MATPAKVLFNEKYYLDILFNEKLYLTVTAKVSKKNVTWFSQNI